MKGVMKMRQFENEYSRCYSGNNAESVQGRANIAKFIMGEIEKGMKMTYSSGHSQNTVNLGKRS